MAIARARRDSGLNYWPGFVDALSTLVLGIIFLLTVFMVVQFYLTQEVTGKDTVLSRLNAQLAQLTELLSLEKTGKLSLEEEIASMRSSLMAIETERDRYRSLYEGVGAGAADAQGKTAELTGQLEAERRLTTRALAQVEVLNQQIAALRRQLAALETALEASESKDRESQARLADLGQRLNIALAQRVQELSRYRSDFFGRLRTILGNRPDVRIVGDRFVFQSEVFFDTGQAILRPEGRAELWAVLTGLAAEAGTTILVTTHYLDEADQFATRIAIVDRGRIVAEGTADQLKAGLQGDSVLLELGDAGQVPRAEAALARAPQVRHVTANGAVLRARVADGPRALPAVLAGLEAAGVAVLSVTVARPSLDDVYLPHAGRLFRQAEGITAS